MTVGSERIELLAARLCLRRPCACPSPCMRSKASLILDRGRPAGAQQKGRARESMGSADGPSAPCAAASRYGGRRCCVGERAPPWPCLPVLFIFRRTVRDVRVDVELSAACLVDDGGQLRAALHAAERAAAPHATSHKLKRPCGDLLSGRGHALQKTAKQAANSTHTHSERDSKQSKAQPADLPQAAEHSLCVWSYDDGALAPALVAALESGAHEIHVSFEIEKLKKSAHRDQAAAAAHVRELLSPHAAHHSLCSWREHSPTASIE